MCVSIYLLVLCWTLVCTQQFTHSGSYAFSAIHYDDCCCQNIKFTCQKVSNCASKKQPSELALPTQLAESAEHSLWAELSPASLAGSSPDPHVVQPHCPISQRRSLVRPTFQNFFRRQGHQSLSSESKWYSQKTSVTEKVSVHQKKKVSQKAKSRPSCTATTLSNISKITGTTCSPYCTSETFKKCHQECDRLTLPP